MKQTKKLIIFALSILALTCLFVFGASAYTGTEYENTGIYYEISNGEATITDCDGDVTIANIPSTIEGCPVTSIGNSAFFECHSLASITIPDGVTSIGDKAFYNCSRLISITIPDSVTSISNNSAFYKCTGLTSIIVDKNNTIFDSRDNCNAIVKTDTNELVVGCKATIIPNSVTSIGDLAFYDCRLTSITIPDSVTSIGDKAFYNCSKLTSITIPDSVTSIGNSVFNQCTGLTSIIVDKNNTIFDSRDNCNAIVKTDTNELVIGCNATNIPNSVTSIGNNAFDGCTGLTSITIPDGVTSIGNFAFEGCSGLTSITIPDSVTSIGDNAFYHCIGLTSITIPDSVTSIGNCAFLNCTGLTSINIPDGVTSIGGSAFEQCTGLTSVTIGNSVTSIGRCAFKNCSELTSIKVDKNNIIFDSRDNCNAIVKTDTNELVVGCKATIIPNSVTSIGDFAFYMCSSLTSITIPNSVTSIGQETFSGCRRLTSITIHDGVTSIGYEAFWNCTGLTSITIPNSVTSIGSRAFFGCRRLKSITIPDSVTNIGENAFGGTAYVNAESNWEDGLLYIGKHFIAAKMDVTSASIKPGTLTIASAAFYHDSGLTNITIPDSVTSIGERAFYGCTGLTSVTIPDSVTSIGERAFYGCTGLTSVTIPDSVTSIGERAFEDCTGLTSITIENPDCEIYDSRNTIHSNAIIYGYPGSTAEVYANKYERTFRNACPHNSTDTVSGTPATCAENGYTAGVKCNDCGEFISGHETIAKLSHTDLNNDNVCDVCGNSVSDILHGETKTVSIESGKVTYLQFVPSVSGTYTFQSNSDSDTYGYLYDADKNEITYNDDGGDGSNFKITYDLVKGTTYYFGCRYYSTSKSGSFEVRLTLDSCSHSFGAWTVIKASTIKEEGQERRICGLCGETEMRSIAKIPSTTITNSEYGVQINYGSDAFNSDNVRVTVTEKIRDDSFYNIPGAYSVLDITTLVNGVPTQPNAPVLVTIAIPNNIQNPNNVKVYHVKSDGTREPVNDIKVYSEDDDYYVEFFASSFSDYIIAEMDPTCSHKYESKVTIASTCTENGVETTSCIYCGDIKSSVVISKTGHIDNNNNGICDECGSEINGYESEPVHETFGERIINFFKGIVNAILELFKRIFG